MRDSQTILGLGTATFLPKYGLGGKGVKRTDALSIIQEAVGRGVRYIDTADDYGDGETCLGELSDLLKNRSVRLCTKLPYGTITTNVQASLSRLHAQNVDTLLLHSPKRHELTDPAIAEAFDELKQSHRVCRTGASTYGIEDAQSAFEETWCDVLQVEHSILNPTVVSAIRELRRPDQEIVVRSVLCKGLLTARRHLATHLDSADVATLGRLESLACDWGYSLQGLAIRFALDTPGVDIVLVGVSNLSELQEALDVTSKAPLESQQMELLAEFDCSMQEWSHPERWP